MRILVFTCYLLFLLSTDTRANFKNLSKKIKLAEQTQCRPLRKGKVNWPINNSKVGPAIDCKKLFYRLRGQTLYLYSDDRDLTGSIALKSNFFKYPDPVDCLNQKGKVIDCPGLDIEKISFKKQNKKSLLATVTHPDASVEKAIVTLMDTQILCQIAFLPLAKNKNYKKEVYNVLALYDGRLNDQGGPACDEESMALAPVFQDKQARNLCKSNIDEQLKKSLKTIDPRDHKELKRRAKKLRKDCETNRANQMKANFVLSPSLDY